MVELLISAMLLGTVMTFITTVYFRVNLVWKDIGHHRVAMAELSNQLETLTMLSSQDAKNAMITLEPSEACARTLTTPKLTGKLVEDELGIRIELQLNWQRNHPGKPVELAGWIAKCAGSDDCMPSNRPPSASRGTEVDQ